MLYNEGDTVDAARVGAFRDDPLIMYLVVARRPSSPAGALLARAAGATLRCAQAYGSDPAWACAFAAWEQSSFRKVCLRARPAELQRLESFEHAHCGEVLCLPPRRRSSAEPELASLQAHIGGPIRAADDAGEEPDRQAMVLLIAEDLEMTLGKACAQVGHAVLIAHELHSPTAVTAWEHAGWPVAVRLAARETFDRAKDELVVAAVRDAGLTQVAPGTETVLAPAPGASLPEWLVRAAKAIA